MKKIICKKEYDTENSTVIMQNTHSYFGDPAGYEETLHQTPSGLYFIHVNGGAESIYPQEDIIRLAKAKVNEWIESHR